MNTQLYAVCGFYHWDKEIIYNEIKKGISRFGDWVWKNNLKCIKKDDWIVHLNLPQQGKCVVTRVIGEYGFDEGFKRYYGTEYSNFIPIDIESIIEFDINDLNNILKTDIITYGSRSFHLQKLDNVQDLLISIENIKNKKFDVVKPQ